MWVDQGSEFYNQSFKDFLKVNNIEIYSKKEMWVDQGSEVYNQSFKNF